MSLLAPLEIGLVQGLLMAGAVLSFALAFRLLDFPDLTVEGSVPLGAATYAVSIHHGLPLPCAVALACLTGAAAGVVTATLHVRFGVNKFLSGIIVVSIVYSLTLRLMGGPNTSLLQDPALFRGTHSTLIDNLHLGVLLPLGFTVGLVVMSLVVFLGSRLGVKVRAAGSNGWFAESVGIPRKIAIAAALAGCNGLAALSGVLQADYQGFADASTGQGVLVVALAALTLGEAVVPDRSMRFHNHAVMAAVVGSLTYHVIVAYAVRAGLAPTDLRFITGVLVLAAVALRMSGNRGAAGEIGVR